MWNKIKASNNIDVWEANNRKVHTIGRITISFEIGGRVEMVNFNVVERRGTSVLLGCDYFDRQIEAIKPYQRTVQLDDIEKVPIYP